MSTTPYEVYLPEEPPEDEEPKPVERYLPDVYLPEEPPEDD